MIRSIRDQFPQISQSNVVYLDSAATALKPKVVIETMDRYYREQTANVHRGAHELSDLATANYEKVRADVARFLAAKSESEIIFTPGTTFGINLIAQAFGRSRLQPGDEILLSQMEHHSNIVPWQMVAEQASARVRFIPVLETGELDLKAFEKMLSPKTKIVSLVHLSNALGVWNPIQEMAKRAKKFGATVIVDAAQSVTARRLNVNDLECDFLVFSGHKLFGPSGVGVLYGKEELLQAMPPFLGGGSMIREVTEEKTTFLGLPNKFEAGTPPIAEVLGLGAAIQFFSGLDQAELAKHDRDLLASAIEGIKTISGMQIYGEKCVKSHILSLNLKGAHPSDVGAILNEEGVAVRCGHHCCMPLMKRFNIPGTVRASFSIYSNNDDVERLIGALRKAKEILT